MLKSAIFYVWFIIIRRRRRRRREKNHTLNWLHSLCAVPCRFHLVFAKSFIYQFTSLLHYPRNTCIIGITIVISRVAATALAQSLIRWMRNTNHHENEKRTTFSTVFMIEFLSSFIFSPAPSPSLCRRLVLCEVHRYNRSLYPRNRIILSDSIPLQSQMTRWYFINSFHYVARIVEWAHLPTITGKDWLRLKLEWVIVLKWRLSSSYCTCTFRMVLCFFFVRSFVQFL